MWDKGAHYFSDLLQSGQNIAPSPVVALQNLQVETARVGPKRPFPVPFPAGGGVMLTPRASAFLRCRALSILLAKNVAVSKTTTNGAIIIKPVMGVGSGPNIQNTIKITT
jgi:hypothetical protein